jgi:peptidoglycan/xylan/chitin deacetylase (PgdA/CDA1 family)
MSLLAVAKRALASGMHRSGLLAACSRRGTGRAIILVYHRVNDDGDPFFPALLPHDFQRQMELVAGLHRVDPLEDVVRWLGEGAEGRARVAITVDDGYPDTAAVVAPILERLGLPATLFLATQPPEDGRPVWTEQVRWAYKHSRAEPLPPMAERLQALGLTLRRLKALPPPEVDAEVARLEGALKPEGPPREQLGWDGVTRLTAGVFRLGGHTHSHYMVSRLDDRRLEEEIENGRRLIEARTGQRVRTFAYPNGEAGDYDPRAIAALKRLGFVCAVTTRHGRARPVDDPFALPRLGTREAHLPLFAARLGGFSREEAAGEVS